MELFATNLRRRAEELGISNAEVARRVGLSDRRYGNYVTGRREPDLSTLVKIADVLGMSVDELVVAKPSEPRRTPEVLSQERIVAALKTLDSDDLQRLAIMIEALTATRRAPAQ